MTTQLTPAVRVLRDVRHGGQVPLDEARHLRHTAAAPNGELPVAEVSTPFGYMFAQLAAEFPAHHLPMDSPATITAALKRLGEALIEEPGATPFELQAIGNSTIPPVYTYWGQFIDHDITANTDRNNIITDVTVDPIVPLLPADVVRDLRNLREPALNLDSVYGDGPTLAGGPATTAADMYDGIRMRLGRVAEQNDDGTPLPGVAIPSVNRRHDLPRENSIALVGDGRNDENLVVAQFHVAMLRFHNHVLAWLRDQPDAPDDEAELFARTRDLVRWHYQWLVVHDYLKTVTLPGVVDKVLLAGGKHFHPRDEAVFMPIEFSVAAYRFGHTMVRATYDYNRNFGRLDGGPGAVLPAATFGLLFAFTGRARPLPFNGDTTVLPANWVVEWDRFVDKGDSVPDHFARRIDTRLAPPLADMTNQVGPDDEARAPSIQDILKRLAVRNLLRGYHLALPTGQAVAQALGVAPLTAEELQRGNSPQINQALADGGFVEATPLWYYVLKEAEVRTNGNSLGELGSLIVAETIIGQLRADAGSYLRTEGSWSPADGALLPGDEPIVTIRDLFRFADVL